MAWEEGFYFGMCKLICKASKSTDKGRVVSIKAKSTGTTYSGTLNAQTGECQFFLPPRDNYTVNLLGEDSQIIYTTSFIADYGTYREISVGYDVNDWQGIKDIVDAGEAASTYEVGQQFSIRINDKDVLFDILDINYKNENNIIFGMHNCLEEVMRFHSINNNTGGFDAMEICDYLNGDFYDSLPAAVQNVISARTWVGSTGGNSPTTQSESHKIWLPNEKNVFGQRYNSLQAEADASAQFEYFLTLSNRIKHTETGALVNWWLGSVGPYIGYACYVRTTGMNAFWPLLQKLGILPCFMIAQEEDDE